MSGSQRLRPRLILVTGLPGAGKSTLARMLARRLRLPLLAKDTIKEPLLDLMPGAASRALSDASFAVLFALASEQLALGSSLILEGNFRKGEHEAPLARALQGAPAQPAVSVAQVLCEVPEDERCRRLLARQHDPSRHPGHRDAGLILATGGGAGHLDLPGERLTLVTDQGAPGEVWWAALERWLVA